ncbi:DinB family protein [Streptomyces sp. NPDC005571]|uniref:DinB family protein n=1 Tax=Streptomyces sp. NPDC005571 TaxID=3156888 RepID=UPI0033B08538
MRALLEWKCGNLDQAGMRVTLGPSSLTLGGLVKHMAYVEDTYFSEMLLGQEEGGPWGAIDWDANPDWDWKSAAEDTPEQLFTLWHEAVARSRVLVEKALAEGGPDHSGKFVNRRGESPNLRYVLVTMIEEYARHVGHADLIRESVDGLVGEDPPRE